MKQRTTITNKLVSSFWRVLAISLVVVAVLLSTIRLGLPHIDEANSYITRMLAQRLNAAVSIATISAEWQQASPKLKLKQLNISATDGTGTQISIDELFVDIDVLGSLLNLTLVTNKFEVLGADINISAHDSKTVQNGTSNNKQKESKQSPTLFIEALKDLALNQLTYFSVLDSKVAIRVQQQTHEIHIQQLSWLNQGQQHKGKGFISLENKPDNIASVAVKLHGDEDDLAGQIYLQTDNVSLASLTQNLLPETLAITDSNMDGQLWVHVEQSTLSHIIGKINPSRVLLSNADDDNLSLSLNQLNFYAQPSSSGWLFNANDISVNIAEKQLSLALLGTIGTKGELDIQLAEAINIDSIDDIIQFTHPPQSILVGASPSAKLTHFWAHLNAKEWQVAAQLDAINLTETSLPGLQNASLGINLHGANNTLSAYSKLEFNDSQILTEKLLGQNLQDANGVISAYVTLENGELQLPLSKININTELTDIDLALSYLPQAEKSLSVVGALTPQKVSHLVQLLPEKYLGQNTYKYLKSALDLPEQAGEVKRANILWHGAPKLFPFTGNNGIFQAQVNVVDTDFLFAQGWPSLSDLTLALFFENADLTMAASEAKLLDVTVNSLQASIPGLSAESLLTIDATAQGTGFAVSEVMKNSILQDSLGKLLTENIIISNELSANLQLQIPFYDAPVVTKGSIDLPNNYIVFNDIDTTLSQAQGTIHFLNDAVTTEDLTANLLSQPVKIQASTERQQDVYAVDIGINGDWNSTELIAQLSPLYAEAIRGKAVWEADVDLAFLPEGFTYDFSLSSNLLGTEISLAAPFNKEKDEVSPLLVVGSGNEKNLNIQASIGDDINFEGVLPYSEEQFSRAHLALGNSEFSGLGIGFSISANLPEMYVDEWYETLDILLGGVQSSTQRKSLFNTPERIFIDTQALHLAGQTLHDVQAVAKQADNNWQIDINSDEARGKVRLFNDWLGSGIDIAADFINLETINSGPDTELSEFDVDILRKLPPLSFQCKTCQLMGKNLGQVTLRAIPVPEGMKLEEVSFSNSQGSLQTSGEWLFPSQTGNDKSLLIGSADASLEQANTSENNAAPLGSTHLRGTLQSKDFGRFLNDFGLQTGMRDSAADFKFDLRWDAAPFAFNFASLNGAVDWRLDDGYLTEISDQGSRIFTILSLDSLIRKLSLDFRDVFAKGFFYEQITGTLALENGVAITDDTVVDGGAGEIEIAGYSDLVNQELNYNMAFAPNVTGNLPALVYFMVSPPTALAALAVNEVLTSAKVFSNVEYSVKGTFAQPIITELGRKSAEIQLPARLQPKLEESSAPITELDKQGIPVILPPPNS